MIKLRLKRLTRRPDAKPQNGTDQSIYRVLCIAMIDDDTHDGDARPLYKASDVAAFGFDPGELKALYKDHQKGLYNWARAKEIHLHSDHKDANGNPATPAMWTKEGWQDRTADLLWNKSVDIVDEAFEIADREGQPKDSYWFSVAKGVYRVPHEGYEAHLDEIRAIHAAMAEAKKQGEDLTEEQAAEYVRSSRYQPDQCRKRFAWPRRHPLRLAMALIPLLLCMATFGVPQARSHFMVLLNDGLGAARKLVHSKTPETPREIFEQAWIDYRAGEQAVAESKVYNLLSDSEIPDYLKAGCYYLLGCINSRSDEYYAALGHFWEGYSVYETMNDSSNMYLVTLEIARVHIHLAQFEEAEGFLTLALDHYEIDRQGQGTIPNLGDYFRIQMDISAKKGDYANALEFAKDWEDALKEDGYKVHMIGATSALGFWYTVNGCLEGGMKYTDRAAYDIAQLNDPSKMHHNQINRVLLHRILGFTPDPQLIGSIRDFARMQHNSRLAFYLDLALRIEPKELDHENCLGEDQTAQ